MTPQQNTHPHQKPLFLLLGVIVFLSTCHLFYVISSRMIPSWDEAHYMRGALGIANGIRSGTLSGAWNGYVTALGFKAPLVCVPAALAMLLSGGLILPAMVSLVFTFAALGIASYYLFRRCTPDGSAAVGSALLLTMPLVTGLTHRFYVELLLLLLSVLYLDLLARLPWRSTGLSLLAGLELGLGVLCKTTFPVLIGPSTAYTLYLTITALGSNSSVLRRSYLVAGRLFLTLMMALLVAGSWYARNLDAVLEHARVAANCESCFYSHWFLVNISSGPYFFISCFALAALFPLVKDLVCRKISEGASQTWINVLLLGFTTALVTAVTVAKATRYSVTWLPAIALLAAVFPLLYFRSRGTSLCFQLGLVGVSLILVLHNSFDILPVKVLRLGDLRLLDDRFPLNVAGWFDDNHPLDRRNFRLAEVDNIIAADAAARLQHGESIQVALIKDGLLINYDYLSLLAAAHNRAISYLPWSVMSHSEAKMPDYIVSCKGFERIYPGVLFYDFYPSFESDVSTHKAPYELLSRLDGPEPTQVLVYSKQIPHP